MIIMISWFTTHKVNCWINKPEASHQIKQFLRLDCEIILLQFLDEVVTEVVFVLRAFVGRHVSERWVQTEKCKQFTLTKTERESNRIKFKQTKEQYS